MSVSITGDSPEAVAYAIATKFGTGLAEAEFLALYGRCLATVAGIRNRPPLPDAAKPAGRKVIANPRI